MRVGLVAAEASGDLLGAALIAALRRLVPDAEFEGVGGSKMRVAGCECWYDTAALSVMGLTEVMAHLPRLWRLRRGLARRWRERPPDVFVGIDAPDFNLGLERRLRVAGVRTVQLVSPSVWAWRKGRVRTVDRACDRILCLFPFEKKFYDAAGVDAAFIGHPLADQIPMQPDRAGARQSLGYGTADTVVAILPGSRDAEMARLGPIFAAAAARMRTRRPDLQFIAPMVSDALEQDFRATISPHPQLEVRTVIGHTRECLAASDAALVASGTATLEAALAKTPLVVAYRIGRISRWLAVNIGGLSLKRYALPNLIADRELAPEYMMAAATPAALSAAVLELLEDRPRREEIVREFTKVHEQLRCNAADRAARAILDVAGHPPGTD